MLKMEEILQFVFTENRRKLAIASQNCYINIINKFNVRYNEPFVCSLSASHIYSHINLAISTVV